ncbi:hypothetical protein KIW84_065480 [Lathyrus oleraceus]|uniref:Uncharacterized protein n=1 Tax=Pisum sativum TaxID=3888 RepID=A0A9D5ACJ1_PEA|nr:hypothetical protein KIW84_065480 [Pisum sativum]
MNILDALSGGSLLSKSYEDGYKLIESITVNTYQWHVTRETANSTQKRHAGVYEVTKTITLSAQVTQNHQMMKNIMTLQVTKPKPVKVVNDASEVIKLRSGKECDGSTLRNIKSSEELPAQDNSKDEVKSTKEPFSEVHNE